MFVAVMELASRQTGTDGLTTPLSGVPMGSGRPGWAPRCWRTWSGSGCYCWGGSLLFVQAVWGAQGRHDADGTEALVSSLPVRVHCRAASWLNISCEILQQDGRAQLKGTYGPIAVTKCPHHPRSHQVKCYLPRCCTWVSSRRPLFPQGIFKLHERHKTYQGFYTM